MAGSQRDGGPDAGAPKNVDENTPLLLGDPIDPAENPAISEVTALNEAHGTDGKGKPLPKVQIILLCFARFIEPVAFFCIFPFINQMVKENGDLDDADVGFYSGLIESLFSLTQMCVMIFWGAAADRIGRKPVLVFSLMGVTAATALFGMAKTIWQMILIRCVGGLFAGTIVTIRTMIAEHSTAETQAKSFSWFAFTGNLGIMIGPLIGGALTDPAHQYPNVFGKIQFFYDYPYALPNLAVGVLCVVAVITTALFVEETLVRKSEDGDGSEQAAAKPRKSTRELVDSPGVPMALYIYGHVMLLAFAFTAITPVYWFTPVELGGYGLQPLDISIYMGIMGLGQSLWTLVAFPMLQARIGTSGVLRACAIASPIVYAVVPLFNLMLRAGAETMFRILVPVVLLAASGISMAFTGVQLAVNSVSPSQQTLGMLNALALTVVSGIRAFSPALFTSLFAIGANTQWLNGSAIWVLMVFLALIYTVVSRYIPDYDEMMKANEQRQRQGEADDRG